MLIERVHKTQQKLSRRRRLQHVADFEKAFLLHVVDVVMGGVSVLAASHTAQRRACDLGGGRDADVVASVERLLARIGMQDGGAPAPVLP